MKKLFSITLLMAMTVVSYADKDIYQGRLLFH